MTKVTDYEETPSFKTYDYTCVFILLFLKDFSISQTQNDIFVEGIGGSNVEH